MYGFEFLTLGISHEIIQNLIRNAVTVDPQVHLKIYLIYGLEDMWDIQWSTWEFQKLVEHWRQEGAILRPIGYLRIPEAAHFVSTFCDFNCLSLAQLCPYRYIGMTQSCFWIT